MLKKTAIAVGLAMVAGTGMAADNSASTSMNASSGMAADQQGMQAGASVSGSASALFQRLDANNDGVLSPSEAKASPRVAKLYSSMDNSASIKTDPQATDPQAKKNDGSVGGITLDQFEAGMQAASGGSAGPAVSGGQTYTLMKDGSKRLSSQASQKAQNGMMRSQQGMSDAGNTMNNTSTQMRENARNKMSSMHSNTQNGMSQMKNNMQNQSDRMRQNAANGAQSQMNGSVGTSSNMQTQQGTGMDDNQ